MRLFALASQIRPGNHPFIAMNGAGTKQNRPFGEASVSAAWGVAWRTRRRGAARIVARRRAGDQEAVVLLVRVGGAAHFVRAEAEQY